MTTIIRGLAFPEGARWRDGGLFLSDVHSHQVLRWTPDGELTILAHIPGKPSGIGFLDGDTLLVASQHDRCVYRVDLARPGTEPALHADVSSIATWHVNDMITDALGRAYVGNYGDGAPPGEPIAPARLALIEPDGTVHAVAEDLMFPNGMAFRAGGRELVVAETRSEPGRLTVFDVDDSGRLSNRRTLVEFESEWPDGLAVDAEDGIWVASPFSGEVIRVDANGVITDRVGVPNPYAVALGGEDGRDLFVCTANTWMPEQSAIERLGSIELVRVNVPAAPA